MKKCFVLVLALMMFLLSCSSLAEMIFTTGGTSGTYYAYGNVLAQYITNNSDIAVTAIAGNGSAANIDLLDLGDSQLGFVQNNVANYAYNGIRFEQYEGMPVDTFTALAALYAETVQVVTCNPEIKTVADLKGKSVSIGSAGSGVYFNALDFLAGYGMTEADIVPQYLSFGDSAEALKDGKIDAAFVVAGAPTPAVTDLCTTKGAYLISLDDDAVAKIQEINSSYAKAVIPAGTYKGIDEDVTTVAIKATIIANADVSEDEAYTIVSTIFENAAAITEAHAKGAELDLAYASECGLPYHAGAAKYFAEKGISRDQLPHILELIKDSYLLLPMIILVYLVCSNTRTMQFSASVAILSAIAVGLLSNVLNNFRANKEAGAKNSAGDMFKALLGFKGSFTGGRILEALEAGGRSTISVGVACGMAGVICGCITVTGLASKMINVIIGIAGSSMMLGLLLTMVCCIVLGMGVPTTANYCIMASTCAPILIKLGVPPIASHFFVFYFGIVADITPPVALAAYAGSAIAKSNPMKTSVTATRLAIAAFIVPFVFAFSPDMLFIDATLGSIAVISITAILGMIAIASGLIGYLMTHMNLAERALSVVGGLLLVIPGTTTDVAGAVIFAAVVALHLLHKKRPVKA